MMKRKIAGKNLSWGIYFSLYFLLPLELSAKRAGASMENVRDDQGTRSRQALEKLRDEMAKVSGRIQEYEIRARDTESTLATLTKTIEKKRLALKIQEARRTKALKAMVHLSQTSPLLALAAQHHTQDVLRGSILLKAAMSHLHQQASLLMNQLPEIKKLHQNILRQKHQLAKVMEALALKKKQLEALGQEELRAAGQEATGDFSTALEAFLREAPLSPQASKPSVFKGLILTPPVVGKILKTFGEKASFNPYGRGIILQAQPKAKITSPVKGTVVFSGPFRGYGNILILGSIHDYHVVLAGLDKLKVHTGEHVTIGQLVGNMGTKKSPQLYMELRRKTKTINPMPWVMKWNNK